MLKAVCLHLGADRRQFKSKPPALAIDPMGVFDHDQDRRVLGNTPEQVDDCVAQCFGVLYRLPPDRSVQYALQQASCDGCAPERSRHGVFGCFKETVKDVAVENTVGVQLANKDMAGKSTRFNDHIHCAVCEPGFADICCCLSSGVSRQMSG